MGPRRSGCPVLGARSELPRMAPSNPTSRRTLSLVACAALAVTSLGTTCDRTQEAGRPAPSAAPASGPPAQPAQAAAPATAAADAAQSSAPPRREAPKTRAWVIDGVERTALVSPPAGGPAQGTSDAPHFPIVFVFHGHGGGSRQVRRSYGIEELWPEAMFLYPQGLPTPGRITDPEGKRAGWHGAGAAESLGDRDFKFFDAMLESALAEGGDPTRVYVTGHSNGGGFSYTLAALRGDRLAAIAPSAASFSASEVQDVDPIPIMHIGGRQDPLVKWAWQEASIVAARRINGCVDVAEPFGDGGAMIYASPTGTPVAVFVTDGDHSFERRAVPSIVAFFKKCRRVPAEPAVTAPR